MSDYRALIQELEAVCSNPAAAVAEEMKRSGRRAIGCVPAYTPDEIIYAAGILPVGLWGGQTDIKLADSLLQNFCCSLIRADLEYGMKGTYQMLTAVVIPNFCDSLKALCKNWPYGDTGIPVLGIAYPQNRIPAAFQYLISEFQFFQERLEKLTGTKVTDEALEGSFGIYEEYRKTCREFVKMVADYPVTLNAKTRHHILKAAYFMDKKIYTEKLRGIIEGLKAQPKEEMEQFKVVLSGILVDAEAYLDILVNNHITVVADDLAQESRQFRTPARAEGTALEKMAQRYMDQRGCSLIYEPEKSRGQMLINMAKDNDADGVIAAQMKFCEAEEYDYPIYRKELQKAGVKLLYVEADQQIEAAGQLENRIQTFVEINR